MAREGAYIPPHRRGRLFDESKTLYARHRLSSREQSWEIGDEIDWRSAEIALPTVQRWFRLRWVSHFQGGDQSAEAIQSYADAPRHVPAAPKAVEKRPKTQTKSRW